MKLTDKARVGVGRGEAFALGCRAVADAMRERTALLHADAERSGFVGAMIAGQVTRAGYASFLRNLLPAYQELESALYRHRHAGGFAALYRPELFRARALERDLLSLAGDDWATRLPLVAEGRAYADRIALAASEDRRARLIAHAYTRFMGDLGGGPLLRRRLAATLGLEASSLSFYEFPGIASLREFSHEYRTALDRAVSCEEDVRVAAEEAVAAFQLNIDLSHAIAAHALALPSPMSP